MVLNFSGQFLVSLSVSLTVTWRNWLSSRGGELGNDMEILGLMTASRSRIVWRMVVSLFTKKSEIVAQFLTVRCVRNVVTITIM
jgi:hypothetical protein